MLFHENELEIALMTYNRPQLVKEWLDLSYKETRTRGISINVCDASTDDRTKKIITEYQKMYPDIRYERIDSNTTPGYMTMEGIIRSKAEYVWITGDSRVHDFSELDETLFSAIKSKPDYCVIDIFQEKEMIVDKLDDLIKEACISTTCTGLSVYRTELFALMKTVSKVKEVLDQKFRNNYAFAFMGYFYSLFSMSKHTAYITSPRTYNIGGKNKKTTWSKYFYRCWTEDLCDLFDQLDISKELKEKIPRQVWEKMGLSSYKCCYIGRKQGDLSRKTYNYYMNNGQLTRVTDKVKRIRFFAYSPIIIVEAANFLYRIHSWRKQNESVINFWGLLSWIIIKIQRGDNDAFEFDGKKYSLFLAEYNCGLSTKLRLSERCAELAIAKEWIQNNRRFVEVGAVTPYYYDLYQRQPVIDPADCSKRVTEHISLFSYEFDDMNVLSISTIEHVGTGEYNLDVREDCREAIRKILDESKSCLITVPLGYNKSIDDYVANFINQEYPLIFVSYLVRGKFDNKWVEKREIKEMVKYGPLWANAICIIEKRNN